MAEKKWTIVVRLGGRTLKAVGDGTEEGTFFEGHDDDIEMAKAFLRRGFLLPLNNLRPSPQVRASYESAVGLTAALLNASGGGCGIISQAPKDVIDFINSYDRTYNYEKRTYGPGGDSNEFRIGTY